MPLVNTGNGLVQMTDADAQKYWASTSTQSGGQAPRVAPPLVATDVNATCTPSAEAVFSWPPRDPCAFANLGYPCLNADMAPNDGSYFNGILKCPDGSPMQKCPNTCAGTAFAAGAFGVDPQKYVGPYTSAGPNSPSRLIQGGGFNVVLNNQLWAYGPPPGSAPLQNVNTPVYSDPTLLTNPPTIPGKGPTANGPTGGTRSPGWTPGAVNPQPPAYGSGAGATAGDSDPAPASLNLLTAAQLERWAGVPIANADQWCWYLAQHFSGFACPAPDLFGGGPPTNRVMMNAATFLGNLRAYLQAPGAPVTVTPGGGGASSGGGSGGGSGAGSGLPAGAGLPPSGASMYGSQAMLIVGVVLFVGYLAGRS